MLPLLARLLGKPAENGAPVFLSTYVPSQCGLATFTRDLATGVDRHSSPATSVVAVTQNGEFPDYPEKVIKVIRRDEIDDYRQAADFVNSNPAINLVFLQHEYGIFGGEAGSYILEFYRRVEKPVITTLHTVLSEPEAAYFVNGKEVLERSAAVVVMLPFAKRELMRLYQTEPEKIHMIHHGVTLAAPSGGASRRKLGITGRVLLVSGLIHRDKGFEYVLQALPAIRERFPDTHVYVVGETHPRVARSEGEAYRRKLEKITADLNLGDYVHFVNRYLELDELLQYYDACDIFLTPHLNPLQITSGTLAYALGMSKPCISTPYQYAKDMLSEGRGMLVDFRSADQIAAAAIQVFEDGKFRRQLQHRAGALGRTMSWDRVAEEYLDLYQTIRKHQYGAANRSA